MHLSWGDEILKICQPQHSFCPRRRCENRLFCHRKVWGAWLLPTIRAFFRRYVEQRRKENVSIFYHKLFSNTLELGYSCLLWFNCRLEGQKKWENCHYVLWKSVAHYAVMDVQTVWIIFWVRAWKWLLESKKSTEARIKSLQNADPSRAMCDLWL